MIAKKIVRGVLLLIATAGLTAAPAHADTVATGYIVATQGHNSPSCRIVTLQTTSGVETFRIAEVSNNDDGILSVTLTALATGKPVTIDYIPGQTSGCGTEPMIIWIQIQNAS